MNNNVLLLGKGYWGKNWYNTLRGKGIPFAVVDPKLNAGKDENGVEVYTDLSNTPVKSFTHAVVAANERCHVPLFTTLIEKGLEPGHILVEKPCGSWAGEAETMSQCYPGYIHLHSEAFKYIQKNLRLIGVPHFYRSTRASMGPRLRTCSIVADYMIHDLYIFAALFQPVHNIQVLGKLGMHRLDGTGTDTAFVTLYNEERRVVADMFSSWFYPEKERKVIVAGDMGAFIWQNDDLYFNPSRYRPFDGTDKFGNVGNELIVEEQTKVNLPSNTPLENELADFLSGTYAGSRMFIEPVWDLVRRIDMYSRYRY